MVMTRAAAAKAARNRLPSPDRLDNDQAMPSIESSPPPSAVPALIISTNNIQYDVSSFDNKLRRRTERGLQDNDIRMKYCAVSDDDDSSPDSTKYFYLDDDITVVMGGKLHQPRCTCGANEDGLACKHIYWVGDQIISALPNKELFWHKQPFQLSPDGSKIQHVEPAEHLDAQGVQWIANQLKWAFRDQELPQNDEELRHSIITMLSVFEPAGMLPTDFEHPESPLASECSNKYQELANLLATHAIRDPGLFLGLRNILDCRFQRRVFFDKIDDRITKTFDALDDYVSFGTTNASPEALRFDVPSCAKELTRLVKAIADFYDEHGEDEIRTREVAARAAGALVTLLDRVTDRNSNVYENISWHVETPMEPAENNLFIALVGQEGSSFVLDALHSIPHEHIHRNHWEKLQHIEQKLDHPAIPAAYLAAFRKLVYENRYTPAEENL